MNSGSVHWQQALFKTEQHVWGSSLECNDRYSEAADVSSFCRLCETWSVSVLEYSSLCSCPLTVSFPVPLS